MNVFCMSNLDKFEVVEPIEYMFPSMQPLSPQENSLRYDLWRHEH